MSENRGSGAFSDGMKFARQGVLACSILAAVGVSTVARAKNIIVKIDGVSNPYLAGQKAGTACCGGDSAPDQSPVLAVKNVTAGQVFTFTSTGGAGDGDGSNAPTAEGYTDQPFSMTADYGTGVSGPLNIYVSALLGVFTTNSVPSGPAPPQLDDGVSAKTYKPGLNQIFFIGQGYTVVKGGGTKKQTFAAPVGATRLYLGVADGSGWFNNTGSITTTVNVKTTK